MKKRIIYLTIVFLFVYFILRNINNGRELLETLFKAQWQFVILALFLQLLHFLDIALLYSKSLKLYEVKWKFRDVLNLSLASLALNVFAPLAPFPGSSVFIQKARKEGIPVLNIAASFFLAAFADYLALTPFLALSIYLQYIGNKFFSYEIIGIIVFLIMILMLFTVLVFGILSPKILKGLFWFFEFLTNLFHRVIKKRNFFISGWHISRTEQFIELSKKILSSKISKKGIFFAALAKHFIDIGTLFLLFLAFGKLIPLTTLLVGYSLMFLFWIVTPTPQGVGFVEVITPAIFSSMGLSIEISTLAVLAFRGLNLWLPVVIGFTALHKIISKKD